MFPPDFFPLYHCQGRKGNPLKTSVLKPRSAKIGFGAFLRGFIIHSAVKKGEASLFLCGRLEAQPVKLEFLAESREEVLTKKLGRL